MTTPRPAPMRLVCLCTLPGEESPLSVYAVLTLDSALLAHLGVRHDLLHLARAYDEEVKRMVFVGAELVILEDAKERLFAELDLPSDRPWNPLVEPVSALERESLLLTVHKEAHVLERGVWWSFCRANGSDRFETPVLEWTALESIVPVDASELVTPIQVEAGVVVQGNTRAAELGWFTPEAAKGRRHLFVDPGVIRGAPPSSPLAVARKHLEAVLHQLEVGEASEGDVRDVKWCATELKGLLADLYGPKADDEDDTPPADITITYASEATDSARSALERYAEGRYTAWIDGRDYRLLVLEEEDLHVQPLFTNGGDDGQPVVLDYTTITRIHVY